MAKISDLIEEAVEKLKVSGIRDARRDANQLIGLALGKDRAFIIANHHDEVSRDEEETFLRYVERRLKREPYQHISGIQEFWRLEFMVSPDVLIPRPETEMIVEEALALFGKTKDLEFCEIGTGSGCISISILDEIETANAFGVDISRETLRIAAENARRHKVLSRFGLKQSDVFSNFPDTRYDLIVSNPPYIPAQEIENLQVEVKDFDPILALTDGGSGFRIIERIIKESPDHLKPGGYLLLEIGIDQESAVYGMFKNKIWEEFTIMPDLQGIPRMVRARLKQ